MFTATAIEVQPGVWVGTIIMTVNAVRPLGFEMWRTKKRYALPLEAEDAATTQFAGRMLQLFGD